MTHNLLDTKVHFVAGKGGVGKTLVAKAMAYHYAQNYKTLLVVLSEEPFNDNEPKIAQITKQNANLYYIKIYPDQTIYEYLYLKVPTPKLLDALLKKSLFKALCAAMPGLSDLTRLGKIWYHADAEHGLAGQIFEKIVVDMPSTGYVGRFLSIASVVFDAVKMGPIAKEARLMRDYFAQASNARLHIVTMPEDLVVEETIELYNLLAVQKISFGFMIINRLLNLELGDVGVPDKEHFPLVSAIIEKLSLRKLEEDAKVHRLSQHIALPKIKINDYPQVSSEEALVRAIETDYVAGFHHE